jgi:hypothetical protein
MAAQLDCNDGERAVRLASFSQYRFTPNLWRECIMKTLAYAIAAISLLAAPIASSAQSSNESLTRAQVRAELIQVEQAGYNPAASNDSTYPADIEAAEARVGAQQQTAQAGANSYGPTTNGSAQSGAQGMQPANGPANAGQ